MSQGADYYQEFLDEAGELLSELEVVRLGLGDAPWDMILVNRAFRKLHNLKGLGAMFGLDHISGFAHEFEDLFQRARGEGLLVSRELVVLALEAKDHLLGLVENGGPAQGEAALTGRWILKRMRLAAGSPRPREGGA
ncbi:MAG: Hpt domain-containing protein [Desulfovibrionaceae bacterium]|nr:Hpt domain-containing protein [Desulfovibrionaceae bacterium]